MKISATSNKRFFNRTGILSAVSLAALLSACGGAVEDNTTTLQATPAAAGNAPAVELNVTSQAVGGAEEVVAQPTFHIAPVVLDAPSDVDAVDSAASARLAPRTQAILPIFQGLSSRRLTVQALQAYRQQHLAEEQRATSTTNEIPLTATGSVTTYTPAQIRAAYGLSALPTSFSQLTSAQAAQLGAGQTIYIIDAYSDPNVATELAAFNTKFGLPSCSKQGIASGTALPLAAASASACVLDIVNANSSGGISNSAPSYDSGWATEIALDVQWSHATAPLARIVLINTPDASTTSFTSAITLANAMGPGIVTMSFGAPEGSWTTSTDSVFSGSGMTYLASTGDSGASVQWPAVSPNVVAVGGTSLTYSGSGSRSETAWADGGGGISLYTPTPSYQTSAIPGVGTLAHRSVSDVSFNADPNTGQFLAIIPSGSSTVNWGSAGGTSISAPQWAGIFAVANAMRAQSSLTKLGDPHTVLYSKIGAVAATYASEFADITKGADGSCSTCSARVGYDQVTGLGTPNVATLLATLAGASGTTPTPTPTPVAPVVTSASVSGKAGTALSFAVTAKDANALTFTLSGAPSGMTISSAGVIAWSNPVAGTYSITVTARDAKTGLSGQGIISVSIASATSVAGPVIVAPAMSGTAGKTLTGTVTVTDPGVSAISISISNSPMGMLFSVNGLTITASWPNPKAGTYSMTVSVSDSAGHSAKTTVPITIK